MAFVLDDTQRPVSSSLTHRTPRAYQEADIFGLPAKLRASFMVCFYDAGFFGGRWRGEDPVVLSVKAGAPPAVLELEYFSYLEFPNEDCSLTGQVAKADSTNNEEILYGSCFLCF